MKTHNFHRHYIVTSEGQIINTKTDRIIAHFRGGRERDKRHLFVRLGSRTWGLRTLVYNSFSEFPLKSNEKIVHLNGDTTDNRFENLIKVQRNRVRQDKATADRS